MNQIVQPNLSASGRIAWCLEYAGPKVFGTTYIPNPNSAWQAWQETKNKHQDANLPQDVAVPMWYSYSADLDGKGVKNWGHVTVNVPGQGIYSSPWQAGTTHAVLPSIAEVERIYGAKYVGWSEDILNINVVEGNDMTKEQAQELSLYLRLLAFNSVDKANANSNYDVSHILADPGYAGALAKSLYLGEWQVPAYKAGHYDEDVKNAGGSLTVLKAGKYQVN